MRLTEKPRDRGLLFRLLIFITPLFIIAGISYWFVSSRRAAALESRSSAVKTWPPMTIATADGRTRVTLTTRCQQSRLDFRIQLLPLETVPDDLPLWIRASESGLLEEASATVQRTAREAPRIVDVRGIGLTTFPASMPAEEVIRTALLHAARNQISDVTIAMKDRDGVRRYDLRADGFTAIVGEDGRAVRAYKMESSIACDPERYLAVASVRPSWH